MITDQRDLHNMVEEMLLEDEVDFTAQETDFLDAMYDQEGLFKEGQVVKINEIYDERIK